MVMESVNPEHAAFHSKTVCTRSGPLFLPLIQLQQRNSFLCRVLLKRSDFRGGCFYSWPAAMSVFLIYYSDDRQQVTGDR